MPNNIRFSIAVDVLSVLPSVIDKSLHVIPIKVEEVQKLEGLLSRITTAVGFPLQLSLGSKELILDVVASAFGFTLKAYVVFKVQ